MQSGMRGTNVGINLYQVEHMLHILLFGRLPCLLEAAFSVHRHLSLYLLHLHSPIGTVNQSPVRVCDWLSVTEWVTHIRMMIIHAVVTYLRAITSDYSIAAIVYWRHNLIGIQELWPLLHSVNWLC